MKPKLDSGERFSKLKAELAKNPKLSDPAAVAAAIGRKKYGNEKMAELAKKGKK